MVIEYKQEILDLIEKLNYHTLKYNEGNPEISDKEWDDMYFKLVELEKKTGFVFSNSPTVSIPHVAKDGLVKVEHNHPMLSLAKTKEKKDLLKFLAQGDLLLMAKVDGLSCSLFYQNGSLVRAETRGDGVEGEDITHNAKTFKGVPLTIPIKEPCVIDGEIVCYDQDFKLFADKYENSRNFASGSARLLDSKECKRRNLSFVAWDWITGYEKILDTWPLELFGKFYILKNFFTVVPAALVPQKQQEKLELTIDAIVERCKLIGLPIDGIVAKINNCKLFESKGRTSHHFKGGIAYKFYDETVETTLKYIEWSMGRTGVLTPIAIFNPIKIEGTTVTRASLHNLNIMQQLWDRDWWYTGLKLYVCKRNQIIPYIEDVADSDDLVNREILYFPVMCPICGEELTNKDGVLICTNNKCSGKFINRLDYFCGKKGLDIKGLSIATLEKLLDKQGWIEQLSDIFHLKDHRADWIKMPGFGAKSVDKILNNIEASRNCTLEKFISALGIPFIGPNLAKELCKHISSYEELKELVAKRFNFAEWAMFGPEKAKALLNFDYTEADVIYNELTIQTSNNSSTTEINDGKLTGIVFVVTGKLTHYKNRQQIKDFIEAYGGKVSDKVTGKTNYLINNDKDSETAKNQTAKDLNIPIITEQEFLEKFGR